MADNNLNETVAKAIEFGSTYPNATTPSSGTTYGAPASNLQQLVTQALQGVLGRSFKPGDHASFQAALNVSFESQSVSGKNVYKHIPRAYPSIGASDIGAGISGAQYSLVTFAKALHQQTQPLIKNLQSLNTNVDEEDLGAITAIFTSAWDELIAELSREGGPRASRADALADSILKDGNTGLLVELGNQLGVITAGEGGKIDFDRAKVVTTEEEGHLTNYIALSDYFIAVSEAWKRYRDTFLGKDLGSGLLLIERSLAVVEDGVNELYMAMDSVNIDQAERLILTVGFDPPDQNLTVEDLLSWISYFASQEGPTLIRDGGRRGVQAIIPTAEKLEQLTGRFISLIRPEPLPTETAQSTKSAKGDVKTEATSANLPATLTLPEQFNHSRVINPLRELQLYVKELLKQAKAIAPPPASTASTPATKPETKTDPKTDPKPEAKSS